MSDETKIPLPIEWPLSALALQQKQAWLPGLLATVRRRRRRRHQRQLVRAATVVVLSGLFVLWQPWRGPEVQEVANPSAEVPTWTAFANDPSIVERCEVVIDVRADWFLDDGGLQNLLLAAERRAGLVRAGDRVFVDPTAVDRWSAEVP